MYSTYAACMYAACTYAACTYAACTYAACTYVDWTYAACTYVACTYAACTYAACTYAACTYAACVKHVCVCMHCTRKCTYVQYVCTYARRYSLTHSACSLYTSVSCPFSCALECCVYFHLLHVNSRCARPTRSCLKPMSHTTSTNWRW